LFTASLDIHVPRALQQQRNEFPVMRANWISRSAPSTLLLVMASMMEPAGCIVAVSTRQMDPCESPSERANRTWWAGSGRVGKGMMLRRHHHQIPLHRCECGGSPRISLPSLDEVILSVPLGRLIACTRRSTGGSTFITTDHDSPFLPLARLFMKICHTVPLSTTVGSVCAL
jgi:hypothetical protein